MQNNVARRARAQRRGGTSRREREGWHPTGSGTATEVPPQAPVCGQAFPPPWLRTGARLTGPRASGLMSRLRILIARARSQNTSRLATTFIVEEVSNMTSLIEAMVNRTPQVLLLSIDFPGIAGSPGIREIQRLNPST